LAVTRKRQTPAVIAPGDPATGDFSDATVLKKFGDVPVDLSTLYDFNLGVECR
jgi:hypothetical protein